jgi:predicted enzyme related to lactoylglutathione lyase
MGTVKSGVPGWVDLSTPDLDATRTFYAELFGWEPQVSPDESFGGYTIFTKDGAPVAGAMPLMSENQPIFWSTYVIVDDADAVAAKVPEAGGTVLVPPMDVADQGRMGVFLDHAGAAIGVWQPGKMRGGELFNSPGSLCWDELSTPDTEGAKAFYSKVFGWKPFDGSLGGQPYLEFKLYGRTIAAMVPAPAGTPPFWVVYFAVEDCDATVAKAVALGGKVLSPAEDMAVGRWATLADPHGATFSVIALSE